MWVPITEIWLCLFLFIKLVLISKLSMVFLMKINREISDTNDKF